VTEIEERLAHLIRVVDDLSDVVGRQDRVLAGLRARVDMLLRRAAERESEGSGGDVMGEERPPHS